MLSEPFARLVTAWAARACPTCSGTRFPGFLPDGFDKPTAPGPECAHQNPRGREAALDSWMEA
jgi:hypothetical protein